MNWQPSISLTSRRAFRLMTNLSSSLANLPRTQKALHVVFPLDSLSRCCYKCIIKVLTLSVKRLLFTLQNVKWAGPFGTRHRKLREKWLLIPNAIKVSIVPDKSIHFIFWLQAIWNRVSIENIPSGELHPRGWSTIPRGVMPITIRVARIPSDNL